MGDPAEKEVEETIEELETVEEEETVEENEEELQEENDEESEETKPETEELWQKVDDTPEEPVSVHAHIKMKEKLKGRVAERDDKIKQLRAELARASSQKQDTNLPQRPDDLDYASDAEYQRAVNDYEQKIIAKRIDDELKNRKQKELAEQQALKLQSDLSAHKQRQQELADTSGISSDLFVGAETTVVNAVDKVMPGQGETVTNRLISLMGEGSEKVMYHIGRTKASLNEFQNRLLEDPTGLQAAIYLGEKKTELTRPTKRKTKAPKPAPNLKGDAQTSSNSKALKRKYTALSKSGDIVGAFNSKKSARSAGVDTSDW